MIYEDGDEDEEDNQRIRWRKLNKIRWWYCTIRYSRETWSNGCIYRNM